MFLTERNQPISRRWETAKSDYLEFRESGEIFPWAAIAWMCIAALSVLLEEGVSVFFPHAIDALPAWILFYLSTIPFAAAVWMYARSCAKERALGPGWVDDAAIAAITGAFVSIIFFFFDVG